MKFLGADILRFFQAWPPGPDWYYDYADLEVEGMNGESLLDLEKKYDGGLLGVLCWQGKGDPPTRIDLGNGASVVEGAEVQAALRAWLKAQAEKGFAVTVPNDQVEAFLELCRERGWKVAK